MSLVSLPEALTREHHDIDSGIAAFVSALDDGTIQPASLLAAFAALRRHIYLEEEFLFPPIREAGMLMPVLVMLREHGALWKLMGELTDLLDARDATAHGDGVEGRCRELLSQLEQHNLKEEAIVYPRAETDLSPEASVELAEFLQSGRTPQGWVCQEAR